MESVSTLKFFLADGLCGSSYPCVSCYEYVDFSQSKFIEGKMQVACHQHEGLFPPFNSKVEIFSFAFFLPIPKNAYSTCCNFVISKWYLV